MYTLLEEAKRHPLLAAIVAMLVASFTAFTLKSVRQTIEAVFKFFFRAVVIKQTLADAYSVQVVTLFLNKKARAIGKISEVFDARNIYVESEDDDRVVWFRVLHGVAKAFWYKGAIILVTPQKTVKKVVREPSVQFLRGTVDFVKLLSDASAFKLEYDAMQSTTREFRVVRHKGEHRGLTAGMFNKDSEAPLPESSPYSMLDEPVNYNIADMSKKSDLDPLGQLSLTDEMNKVVKDIKFWFSRRKWYRDRGITWRRGVLMYGAPGTGKTSCTRAIAQDLDLPIHIFDLSSMDNTDLIEAWESTRDDGPRICLLEDIDSIFHGRENIMEGNQLSFDCLLNLIDGVEKEDGLLLMVTTNHIEHIDPALGTIGPDGRSTRPGRIDMIAQLKGLDHKGRVKIGMRILRDDLVAEKLAIDGSEDTAAQFVERCIGWALNDLWNEQVVSL